MEESYRGLTGLVHWGPVCGWSWLAGKAGSLLCFFRSVAASLASERSQLLLRQAFQNQRGYPFPENDWKQEWGKIADDGLQVIRGSLAAMGLTAPRLASPQHQDLLHDQSQKPLPLASACTETPVW